MYSSRRSIFHSLSLSALSAILIAGFFSPASGARSESAQPAPESAKSVIAIPAGTVIPVGLPAISSEKSKKGAALEAWVAQEVPLPNGEKLYRRTSVLGHIIDVTREAPRTKASVAFRFDTIVQRGQSISVATSLRAMASPLEVEVVENPAIPTGQGELYDWVPTTLVGGEKIYGQDGPVANGGRIVGHGVNGGVLARLNARASTNCDGDVAANGGLQALWVFSSDACGPYGFPHLTVPQPGQTAPVGEIVLTSSEGPLRISAGSAMLLRVLESSPAPK
jgi:hypothetical protein